MTIHRNANIPSGSRRGAFRSEISKTHKSSSWTFTTPNGKKSILTFEETKSASSLTLKQGDDRYTEVFDARRILKSASTEKHFVTPSTKAEFMPMDRSSILEVADRVMPKSIRRKFPAYYYKGTHRVNEG